MGEIRRASARQEWRLHWTEEAGEVPGLPHDPDETVGLWVGAGDPARIKAFAADQEWPAEMPVRVTLSPDPAGGTGWASVRCRLCDLADWDPATSPLPAHVDCLEPKRTRAGARLACLRGMHEALDLAVEDGAMHADDATGLLLLARDAMDRVSRQRPR